jgi:hypothetical protein
MIELKALMNDYLRIVHPALHIVSGDSAEYNIEELKQHPEAMEFGCQPYKNAWTNTTTKAQSLAHSPWRTAGFHIHIGYDDPEIEINKLIVKAFDFFVTTQARKIYNDKIRSYYYGELGSYRNTSYGCEARSLGGYFTKDEFLPKVYDGAIQAIEYVNELLITNQTDSLEKAMSVNEIQYDRTPIFIF